MTDAPPVAPDAPPAPPSKAKSWQGRDHDVFCAVIVDINSCDLPSKKQDLCAAVAAKLGRTVKAVGKHYETFAGKIGKGDKAPWGNPCTVLLDTGRLTTKTWTVAEHETFLTLIKQHGNDWATVAAGVPGRSASACEQHYHSFRRKVAAGEDQAFGAPSDQSMLLVFDGCTSPNADCIRSLHART